MPKHTQQWTFTDLHTRTHARTHTHTQKHTRIPPHHTHTSTHIHTRTTRHTDTYTHLLTHTHTQNTHTLNHTNKQRHTLRHTHTHTHTHTFVHTHIHTCVHTKRQPWRSDKVLHAEVKEHGFALQFLLVANRVAAENLCWYASGKERTLLMQSQSVYNKGLNICVILHYTYKCSSQAFFINFINPYCFYSQSIWQWQYM